MIFPSRPTLETEPLPSSAQGSVPSILVTYSTLPFSSYKTDSGTFSKVSVSHFFTSWGTCALIAAQKSIDKDKRIDFLIRLFLNEAKYTNCMRHCEEV